MKILKENRISWIFKNSIKILKISKLKNPATNNANILVGKIASNTVASEKG